jgi:biopolymer transport protein ExbD
MIKKKAKASTEIPTASMSDINFLLLIFFLVSTMFAVEKGLPMALPGKTSQTVKLKREAVLNIQAFANGSIVIRGSGPVSLRDIKPIVEQKLVENPKLVVVIETASDAEYGLMVDILDELRLAQATRISLRTIKAES